jgi:beta-glucosidase
LGGGAVADLLLGRFSPAGKMPYTLYAKGFVGETPMTEHDLRVGVGRTYRYYNGSGSSSSSSGSSGGGGVLRPFGFGLTYTTFALQAQGWSPATPIVTKTAAGTPPVAVTVSLANTGGVDSEQVVLAFFTVSKTRHRATTLYDRTQRTARHSALTR